MSLVKESTEKQHTYVVLNQDISDEDNISIKLQDQFDNQIENNAKLELQSRGSEESVGEVSKPQSAKLISNSRFSDLTLKLFSAILYGVCSFFITVINKIVLTSYEFPSSNLLGLGQMIAILIILKTASLFRLVTIRKVSIKNKKMWTLSTIYICNLITGLGSTKRLPLPMFIALRRFSIAMTAIGEFYLLHIKQTFSIILTIVAMIGGSFVAAASDLTFNAIGYLLVMAGNFFTAANVIYIKKTIDSHELNKNEILFYSALFTIIPFMVICSLTNSIEVLQNYTHWGEIGFIFSFLGSCVMGYLLMFSTILCTHYNSPLTTTIVGTLKNILTTYVGMYIGGDYKYSTLNFVGLNISLIGSLVYSYLTFIHKNKPKEQMAISRN